MSANKAIEFIPQKWDPLLMFTQLRNLYLTIVLLFGLWFILVISNSWIIFLAILEITIIVILFVRLQPLSRDRSVLFRYFLLQTAARICVVAFFLGYFRPEFILVILIIKLIMPPFHVWVTISIKLNEKWNYFWVIIVMKLPTFILLIVLGTYYFLDNYIILCLMFWSAILSLGLMWNRGNLLNFLISSSFLHTVWTVLTLLVRKNIFLCYYVLYALVLFIILSNLYRRFEFLLTNRWSWDVYVSLFVFSGAPPSFIFLIKWTLLFRLIELNLFLFLIALIISGASLYLYFRLIFSIVLRGVESFQVFQKSKVFILINVNMIGLILWVVVLQLSFKLKT